MTEYGKNRAAEYAFSLGEDIDRHEDDKAPSQEVDTNEAVRQEQLASILALRNKVAELRLQQGDSEIQIAHLKDQIQSAPDTEVPALTGERVQELKRYQTLVAEASASLPQYEEKCRLMEARYRTVFPDFVRDLE